MDNIQLGKYRHYKGKEYEVLGVAVFGDDGDFEFCDVRFSENIDILVDVLKAESGSYNLVPRTGGDSMEGEFVLYMALYDSEEFGDRSLWFRPREMFSEDIETDEGTRPRFEFVSDK